MARFDNLHRVAALDPERDHLEIYRLTALHDFPWDVTRALELALYRTYCVPSIAALLDETGEFRLRTQKRYDDTVLLMSEVLEQGYDSVSGRAALSRLNRIHGRFAISNDDFRYVLTTFVVVPVRWLQRYGWRPLHPHEVTAAYAYYREVGRRMGIKDIPASYDETAALMDAYEAEHFASGGPQTRTAVATRELLVSWLPGPLAPVVRLGVSALLDDEVRDCFGFPAPPRWLPPVTSAGLRARARVVRRLPPRRRPVSAAESRLVRSYPDGYDVSTLGPP